MGCHAARVESQRSSAVPPESDFLFAHAGLIFSVFRKLAVGNDAPWAWLWVLPAAFCFTLQAASIVNDLIGAHSCWHRFTSASEPCEPKGRRMFGCRCWRLLSQPTEGIESPPPDIAGAARIGVIDDDNDTD